MAITLTSLLKKKEQSEKIAMLTVYDASFARLLSELGIDILLVGDSLGNVIQGQSTTIPVTLEHMIYHTECVTRGNQGSFLLGDLPFLSYGTPTMALQNAAKIMQAGAHMIKMEGGLWLEDTIRMLSERGIPVCPHIGLTPQSVHKFGGYKLQGTTPSAAEELLTTAMALEAAGAKLILLECIPAELADKITKKLSIPTIGIGAGPHCDGQVLVLYDVLGISTGKIPSFVRNFVQGSDSIANTISHYIQGVKKGDFPAMKTNENH